MDLGAVQETLLLPLWGRAIETRKKNPLLVDATAVSVIDSLPYDFSVISKNISSLSRQSWIARSIWFDNRIREFCTAFPDAMIVNIGCGLDTSFDRIDNGTINWIDLDLPDTIELRRHYIQESARRRFVPKSVFDTDWYRELGEQQNVMLLIAGVLYYFDESEVKSLFRDFNSYIPGAEIVFDYSSYRGVRLANKRVIESGGMDISAYLKWGIDDIFELEQWECGIEVIDTILMFREHKRNFPARKRIGMNISDRLKIMSLAHVSVTG